MSLEEEQAKDQTNEGLEDKATGDAPTSPPEAPAEKAPAAKVEQPKEGKVEGKEELSPQKFQELQEQLTTTKANLKQAATELNEARKGKSDFDGLTTAVGGLRTDLEFVTDVLSHLTSENEELQEKVTKRKQDRDKQEKQQGEAKEAWGQMGDIAKIGQKQPDDEALKPALAAYGKGDFKQAVTLTTLAVQSKVSSLQISKLAEGSEPNADPNKPPEKKKLPVVTGSPAPAQDWRDETSKSNITEGLREKREE